MVAFHSRFAVIPLLGLCLFADGCGKGLPPTGQVKGKVLLDGQPLNTGSVLFIPDPTGQYASGSIQQDGSFSLTTFRDGDGALVGRHKVIVSAVKTTGEGNPLVPLTPAKYSNEKTSGLVVQVEKGQNNVDLELTSVADKKVGKKN